MAGGKRKQRLRVAVVGVGTMGRNHVRVLSQLGNARLVGLFDVDSSVANALVSATGIPAYRSLEELLTRARPDLVVVAVPTSAHRLVAEPILQRGVAVLVEKPLAGDVRDALALVELARYKGIRLGVGHTERFNPVIAALRRFLGAGELGMIYSFEARRLGPFPPRVRDAGVIVDLCTHDIDVVTHLHPVPVRRVHAESHHRIHENNEDVVTAILRFEDGVLATLEASWLTPMKVRELVVTGERGMFLANYLNQELFLIRRAEAVQTPSPASVQHLVERFSIEVSVARAEPLRVELESFVSALLEDRPFPVTGEEALEVLRLAERVRAAARDSSLQGVAT